MCISWHSKTLRLWRAASAPTGGSARAGIPTTRGSKTHSSARAGGRQPIYTATVCPGRSTRQLTRPRATR